MLLEVRPTMSGLIFSVNVKVNDKINQGDSIMALESMKLQTQVISPVTGTVRSIKVSEGDFVEDDHVVAEVESE